MPQKHIAVAGGSGTIGSSIIRALCAKHKLYKPIVLSRATPTNPPGTLKTTTALVTTESGDVEVPLETRYVDYTSADSLHSALVGVEAVISALLIPGPEIVPYQLNLLDASIRAGVRRFAPSEFALPQAVHGDVDVDGGKIVVWDACRAAVADGKIDAAAFPCGMFMNYLGIGAPEDRREEALAGFREGPMIFHLDEQPQAGAGEWVEIPLTADGGYPDLTMTDIRDVGRFVVAALGLEEPWGGREMGMVGETRNLGEIVRIIEGVLGRAVEVRAVERETLQRRLDGVAAGDILAQIDIQYTMVCGQGGSVVQPVLNGLCPDVKPTTIQGFMEKYWG
ncbi:uncharacterized protein BJX67DRAFT_377919 [Aspergillus lucknowensis]|uniref:NmrA-like domain-containing protein n=1 Tax=Aspergillus lucknowensis TaxID=176173 RepID=A0ABR4M197_9EURO